MHTTLFVRGLEILGTHGDTHNKTQKLFIIDMELMLRDIENAIKNDSLRDTIDYRDAVMIARRVISGPSVHLIETIAHTIATQVLTLPHIQTIKLTLTKRELKEGFDSGITVSMHRTEEQ